MKDDELARSLHAVFLHICTAIYTKYSSMQQSVHGLWKCMCDSCLHAYAERLLCCRWHLLMTSCIASELSQGCRISVTTQHQGLLHCQSLPQPPQVRCRLCCHVYRVQTVCRSSQRRQLRSC